MGGSEAAERAPGRAERKRRLHRPNLPGDPPGIRAPRRVRAVLRLVSVLLLLGAATAGCGGDEVTDNKKTTYKELDRAFQPLRRDFEIESGKVRIVALVSPSCGRCIEATEDIYNILLRRIKSEDLAVLVVWASVVPPDVSVKAERLAQKYVDPRIVHYWDDSGRIARAFARHLGVDPGLSVNDIIYIYGRNDTWDPNGTMATEPPNQNALIAGWTPTSPRYRMGYHKDVQMPEFDVNVLTRDVEELLAEPDEATQAEG